MLQMEQQLTIGKKLQVEDIVYANIRLRETMHIILTNLLVAKLIVHQRKITVPLMELKITGNNILIQKEIVCVNMMKQDQLIMLWTKTLVVVLIVKLTIQLTVLLMEQMISVYGIIKSVTLQHIVVIQTWNANLTFVLLKK